MKAETPYITIQKIKRWYDWNIQTIDREIWSGNSWLYAKTTWQQFKSTYSRSSPESVQRAEKNLRNNFLSLLVMSYWNSLPDNIVQALNIKTFESRLNQYWKEYEGKYDFRSTYSPTVNSTIHKAAGFTVPGRSMVCLVLFLKIYNSRQWSREMSRSLKSIRSASSRLCE